MKGTIIAIAALALCVSLGAQDKAGQLKPYGFVRTYFAFDTRESVAGTEDFFFYLPKDENIKDGVDLNEQNTFRFASLTSRLGVNLVGFEYDGYKVGGKIETDFYNGVSGVTGTAVLRLRQAFATIGKDDWMVTAGQAWHPMAADLPDVFSLNTGAPFGPFSRTPLVRLDWNVSPSISFTGAAIWQMQYTSAGPGGAKADYIKYGCTPELFFGVNYTKGGFLGRAGVDMLSIKPRWNDGAKKVSDRITTVSPYVYAQYRKGLFSAKVKTIFAQAGEHMNLNGGYGVSGVLGDGSYEYTPTRNSSTWVSLMYGKKTQWILFGGYVKNFGTKDALHDENGDGLVRSADLYFSKNSFSNMNQMWRLTPTVIRNIGKFAVGLEYEITSVQYGAYKKYTEMVDGTSTTHNCVNASNGLAGDNLHWVANNRIQALVKFTF